MREKGAHSRPPVSQDSKVKASMPSLAASYSGLLDASRPKIQAEAQPQHVLQHRLWQPQHPDLAPHQLPASIRTGSKHRLEPIGQQLPQ